ncbi:DUF3716 domain-containing protein [Aspergillus mulundensis]|uniref:Uncharacterized protein n=1 Tax=Aspergillus mulundensis TaxID=1810919 RepID=A0A3D8RZE0_9EURO|nr:hypothetical protein DSM5745_06066 [Aspergillus mulundensis]RDW79214.1 hypothetical protein DSM5745_06066 [Aspergillus mulundensis]
MTNTTRLLQRERQPSLVPVGAGPRGQKRPRAAAEIGEEDEDRVQRPCKPEPSLSQAQPSRNQGAMGLPREPIQGLDPQDHGLPIATGEMARRNPALARLMAAPYRRKLDWRDGLLGNPVPRALPTTSHVYSAYMQTRHPEATAPCIHCVSGNGPWKTCVVAELDSKTSMFRCVNCRYSRYGGFCGLSAFNQVPDEVERLLSMRNMANSKNWLADKRVTDVGQLPKTPGSPSRPEPTPTPCAPPPEWVPPLFMSPARHYAQRPSLPSPSLPFRGARCAQPIENAERKRIGAPGLANTATAAAAQTKPTEACRAPSLADGNVLPFPLGQDAIRNLPLLTRAQADLENHLAIIEERIRDLQEQERKERELALTWGQSRHGRRSESRL